MLEFRQQKICDLGGCYLFFETCLTLQSLWISLQLLRPLLLLSVPLEDSSLFQVYQWCKKIITSPDSLSLHQLIASTEVFELLIALRKDARSCTHHPIAKVLYFSHISLAYFSFATRLSFMFFSKFYRNVILDSGWKVLWMKKWPLCLLMKHEN